MNKETSINGNDGILARGAVDIKVFENGKLIRHIEENNLVVLLGKQNVARLIGGLPQGVPITSVGVGENGVAPSVADNALTNAFTKPVDSVTEPGPVNQVMFNFQIDNSEANGLTIREFGLLNSDGVLCARKTRTEDIIKTAAIRLVGTWTITVN